MLSGYYLEKRDLDKNQLRFYALHLTRGLFDNWALIREWGRIGSPGTVRSEWFESQAEAERAAEGLLRSKQQRGYQLVR